MKEFCFSGWYKVEVYDTSPSKMVMRLIVRDTESYDIELTLKELKIKSNMGRNWDWDVDLDWIPKYMLRPNKWGIEIFNTNREFTMLLWALVADKEKLKRLKGHKPNTTYTIGLI